jgi:hypothetical protein
VISLRATRASIRGRGAAVPVQIRPARRSTNPNGLTNYPRRQQRPSDADSMKPGTGRMTETLIDDLLAARSRLARG